MQLISHIQQEPKVCGSAGVGTSTVQLLQLILVVVTFNKQ